MALNSDKKTFLIIMIVMVVMVYIMIILGGLTRLLGAGLSIVEWKPITGILPPLNDNDWLLEFGKYQASPEFLQINFDFKLADFKIIFWLEYVHRLWGRLIGFILIIPIYLAFWKPALFRYRGVVVILVMLMLLQGFMGWYMVKSGLSQNPYVSPYRLTTHLFLGLAILVCPLWIIFDILRGQRTTSRALHFNSHFLFAYGGVLLGLIILTITYGGLVAGLKAGLIYNTFPLMNGEFIPEEVGYLQPLWLNFFANPATVQWLHRVFATLVFILAISLSFHVSKRGIPEKVRRSGYLIAALAMLQFILGIWAILYQAPPAVASLHQGVAILLFTAVFYFTLLMKDASGQI